MSKLTIYCDGSEVTKGIHKRTEYCTVSQGWGIVAYHTNGNTKEIHGAIDTTYDQRGYYELLAFYNAITYAEQQELIPKEVSIYTDDAWIAYSGFDLVPSHCSPKKKAILKRLRGFRQRFCPNDNFAVMRIVRWMMYAQLHWVKGHCLDTNNNRADYLARSATANKKPVSFWDWIKSGYSVWDESLEQTIHTYLPFVRSI
jgi:ribonuclease HI